MLYPFRIMVSHSKYYGIVSAIIWHIFTVIDSSNYKKGSSKLYDILIKSLVVQT